MLSQGGELWKRGYQNPIPSMPPLRTSDQCKSLDLTLPHHVLAAATVEYLIRLMVASMRLHGRYRYQHDAAAAQAIIMAQSDMLQPLKQLRRLVWVENCPGRRITLPWPGMPANLEELELTSGVHLQAQMSCCLRFFVRLTHVDVILVGCV